MTSPTRDTSKGATLDRVRKLLAKAEAEGVTPPEAEALTAKAAELMARYGIDRTRLGALHPETDKPSSRIVDIDNPWAQVRAHLLAGIAGAMNCQCVLLSTSKPGARIHLFGYASDLERADIMYTSLLLQMASALRWARPPQGVRSVRALRLEVPPPPNLTGEDYADDFNEVKSLGGRNSRNLRRTTSTEPA